MNFTYDIRVGIFCRPAETIQVSAETPADALRRAAAAVRAANPTVEILDVALMTSGRGGAFTMPSLDLFHDHYPVRVIIYNRPAEIIHVYATSASEACHKAAAVVRAADPTVEIIDLDFESEACHLARARAGRIRCVE